VAHRFESVLGCFLQRRRVFSGNLDLFLKRLSTSAAVCEKLTRFLPAAKVTALLRLFFSKGCLSLLLFVCATSLAFFCTSAGSQTPPPQNAEAAKATAVVGDEAQRTVLLNQRKVVMFRATLLGDSPIDRAELAREALQSALAKAGPGLVTRTVLGESVQFSVDGQVVFFLVADDLLRSRSPGLLEAVSQEVLQKLQLAVRETKDRSDPKKLATGAAYSAAATLLAYGLLRLIFWLRRKVGLRLKAVLQFDEQRPAVGTVIGTYADHLRMASRFFTTAVAWGFALLVAQVWASYVLQQFAISRPWGERSTVWLLGVLEQFALAIAAAVPGILIAVLIFVMARMVSQATKVFLQRVERGDISLTWLDADTAVPTQRLSSVVIWLFAFAMAYPYLPGSNSEAFKGVSVVAGLMLSLGASSVVGQALSGFSLMYSHSLRLGEYVKVGDTEGTVVALGLFTTKVHTGMGEVVSVPNSVVFAQPIRNFSRLAQEGQFMMQAVVTIGYATPWRQVHAMLMEAAHRSHGVALEPAPYVVQTALSDFYVEYRLCAQSNKNAPSRRAEAISQLHANILDVFNENGVQIMSPHYMADPAAPQVVPPGGWSPLSVGPIQPPAADAAAIQRHT
jgi:small-conductance mechanosensitive channel